MYSCPWSYFPWFFRHDAALLKLTMAGKSTQRKARKIPTLRQHKVEISRRRAVVAALRRNRRLTVVHSADKSELSRFRPLPFGPVGD